MEHLLVSSVADVNFHDFFTVRLWGLLLLLKTTMLLLTNLSLLIGGDHMSPSFAFGWFDLTLRFRRRLNSWRAPDIPSKIACDVFIIIVHIRVNFIILRFASVTISWDEIDRWDLVLAVFEFALFLCEGAPVADIGCLLGEIVNSFVDVWVLMTSLLIFHGRELREWIE